AFRFEREGLLAELPPAVDLPAPRHRAHVGARLRALDGERHRLERLTGIVATAGHRRRVLQDRLLVLLRSLGVFEVPTVLAPTGLRRGVAELVLGARRVGGVERVAEAGDAID